MNFHDFVDIFGFKFSFIFDVRKFTAWSLSRDVQSLMKSKDELPVFSFY